MKETYKDCEIEIFKDRTIIGGDVNVYMAFDCETGFEIVSGCSYDTFEYLLEDIKNDIDDYKENPEKYL